MSVSSWYEKHLKEWLESYVAELAKGIAVLLGLVVFRLVILVVKQTGMDETYLALLEELHFWLQYATIAALGFYSLLKLIGGML